MMVHGLVLTFILTQRLGLAQDHILASLLGGSNSASAGGDAITDIANQVLPGGDLTLNVWLRISLRS